MKNLWNFKSKRVGKEILDKKEEEFKVEWSRSEFWRGKAMGNLEELWKKCWKINEGSEKKGRNLVNFDEIGSVKEELKKLGRMLMEVLEREKERKRERVGWKMKRKAKRPIKTCDHGLGRFTTGHGVYHGLSVVSSVQAPAFFLFRIFFGRIPRAMVECTVFLWYFENLEFFF